MVRRALKNRRQVLSCGMGEEQARLFCAKLNASPCPAALVLVGWGGGLASDLAAGEGICAAAAWKEGCPALACAVLPIPGCRSGPVLTVPSALLSLADKRAARDSGALAVEMEAYPLAQWAAQKGIPFYHVRLILDAWDDPLPDLGPGLDLAGQVRPGPLLAHLARCPAVLAELWRLAWRVSALSPRLARLAVEAANRI